MMTDFDKAVQQHDRANSTAKFLNMLNTSSECYMELFKSIADSWAVLKDVETEWHDELMITGDQTAFQSYLDLCHALHELRAVQEHLENAYESALDEYAKIGNE